MRLVGTLARLALLLALGADVVGSAARACPMSVCEYEARILNRIDRDGRPADSRWVELSLRVLRVSRCHRSFFYWIEPDREIDLTARVSWSIPREQLRPGRRIRVFQSYVPINYGRARIVELLPER